RFATRHVELGNGASPADFGGRYLDLLFTRSRYGAALCPGWQSIARLRRRSAGRRRSVHRLSRCPRCAHRRLQGAFQDRSHDWDVPGAPAIVKTAAGKRVMLVAPKDGHLYGFDLDTKEMLYRLPVTAIENADVLFSPEKSVHFCPGSIGGAEWNGPAYNPQKN